MYEPTNHLLPIHLTQKAHWCRKHFLNVLLILPIYKQWKTRSMIFLDNWQFIMIIKSNPEKFCNKLHIVGQNLVRLLLTVIQLPCSLHWHYSYCAYAAGKHYICLQPRRQKIRVFMAINLYLYPLTSIYSIKLLYLEESMTIVSCKTLITIIIGRKKTAWEFVNTYHRVYN